MQNIIYCFQSINCLKTYAAYGAASTLSRSALAKQIKGLFASRGVLAAVFSVFLACASANSAEARLFGKSEVESSDVSDFTKWKAAQERHEESVSQNSPEITQWQAETEKFAAISDRREQIQKVNSYINKKIKYVPDSKLWHKADYWSSPEESFKIGKGDCEDYAIAKYYTLKALGFDESQMRIVIVHELRKGEIHAVLAVTEGGQNYILDNQSASVKEDSDIAYYSPIYSINSHNWWRSV